MIDFIILFYFDSYLSKSFSLYVTRDIKEIKYKIEKKCLKIGNTIQYLL